MMMAEEKYYSKMEFEKRLKKRLLIKILLFYYKEDLEQKSIFLLILKDSTK